MEDQPKQSTKTELDINIAAHEDGSIRLSFNIPVTNVALNPVACAKVINGLSAGLLAVLERKVIVAPNG